MRKGAHQSALAEVLILNFDIRPTVEERLPKERRGHERLKDPAWLQVSNHLLIKIRQSLAILYQLYCLWS